MLFKSKNTKGLFGSATSSLVMESLSLAPVITAQDTQTLVFEAIDKKAQSDNLGAGMSAVITWAEGSDTSADDLDAMAIGMADVDADGEISADEEAQYNEVCFAMAQAMVFMGVDYELAKQAMTGDDDAASDVFVTISDYLDSTDKTADELIAEFSVSNLVTESAVKVIRHGEVVWVTKKLKKRHMSPAQKAALKKARMKAHSASAKAARARSMKMRKSM